MPVSIFGNGDTIRRSFDQWLTNTSHNLGVGGVQGVIQGPQRVFYRTGTRPFFRVSNEGGLNPVAYADPDPPPQGMGAQERMMVIAPDTGTIVRALPLPPGGSNFGQVTRVVAGVGQHINIGTERANTNALGVRPGAIMVGLSTTVPDERYAVSVNDGLTWPTIQGTPGGGGAITDIYGTPTCWLLLCLEASSWRLFRSTQLAPSGGGAWTQTLGPVATTAVTEFYRIRFGQVGTRIIVALAGVDPAHGIYYSDNDGVTWTQGASISRLWTAHHIVGDSFIAVQDRPDLFQQHLWWSPDGVTWTNRGAIAGFATANATLFWAFMGPGGSKIPRLRSRL